MATDQLGRYQLIEEIGQGGFAIVYRAHDTDLDRVVALKELRPALLADTSWVSSFRREARAIARLDHPNIVTIYDVGEAEAPHQRLYLVMRLVNGRSLEEVIRAQGRLSWRETVEIITAVAHGLDYAHENEILHRDLKPANILIDEERGAMLSDFGLAKLAGDTNSLSASGSVVGTPHYIAPEVWEGSSATARSDLYALGCILYEMLRGEKTFKGDTPPAIMMAHFMPLKLPETWPEDVPVGIGEVLKKALAQKPAERFASAGEMLAAIRALNGEEVVDVSGVIPVTPPSPPPVIAPETPTPSPATPTPTPVPEHSHAHPMTPHQRGCLTKSIVGIVGTMIVTVIVVGIFCNTLRGIANDLGPNLEALGPVAELLLPPIEIGETVVEDISLERPSDGEIPNLEINFTGGEMNVTPHEDDDYLVQGDATYNVEQLKPIVLTASSGLRLEQDASLEISSMTRQDVKNRWDLQLGTTPMNLHLDVQSVDGNIELGGLSLTSLSIEQNTRRIDLSILDSNNPDEPGLLEFGARRGVLELGFMEPNRVEMASFEVTAGFAETRLRGLANTRTPSMEIEVDTGDHMFGFNGDLVEDMAVRIRATTGTNLVILVPHDQAAELIVSGEANIEFDEQWQEVENDRHYTIAAEGPTITFRVDSLDSTLTLMTLEE